ncbi:SMI1/KNR4 family protein [Humisphaera borealis]|uniref:SMI1/KNR4 family protein n=1 Tax=Humisphaera borealis TaxID=2807512 RepID=A0A7M2X5C7_9BACT|nr:SMI1/KNR4 family protein [Humisphaera borealis]QOV92000.1 SMI1/KNR4 family protein [Humisphaera borealis]
MSLKEVVEYFERVDPKVFEYWCCQETAPAMTDVDRVQADTGFTLPDEFRQFTTSRLAGMHIVVREEVWPRRQGGAFWWFLYGISVFGIGRGVPDWLDMQAQYQRFQDEDRTDLMPFMRVVGDPDRYCFTRVGEIVRWSNNRIDPMPIKSTFSELMMRELMALEERKDRVLRDGLTR